MARSSRLFFDAERTPPELSHSLEGEPLFVADHGIPLAWLFLFGGRNVWDIGDDVQARGGAVGHRNIYESTVETAVVRLTQAGDALRPLDHAWCWFAPMELLRRKLLLKPKTGYVRLAAPWVVNLEGHEQERWKSLPAFLENFVNFYSAGRRTEAAESIRRLQDYCLFVPEGHGVDRHRFPQVDFFTEEQERALRLALLMLGEPAGSRDVFVKAALKDVEPALAAHLTLDPLPPPGSALIKLPPKPGAVPQPSPDPAAAAPLGLMGRLAGLFRRSG